MDLPSPVKEFGVVFQRDTYVSQTFLGAAAHIAGRV
jgi:hypothetical protein